MIVFTQPQEVAISQERWHLFINVVDDQGAQHSYVASADAYYTGRDRLWFGTQQEWEEYE